MKIDIFQINAFTNSIFGGNTSAVCPLDNWIDDLFLQKIAKQTNLKKTAFIVKNSDASYQVRWFTPEIEVTINDHTALASAYVIFNYLEPELDRIILKSLGGEIKVNKEGSFLTLNFESSMPELHRENNPLFSLATGIEPLKVLKEKDFILVYENEDIIKNINPNLEVFKSLDLRGVCLTAQGKNSDFVFRYFAPKLGLKEDLVTGSVCAQIAPYWAQVLEKQSLTACQYTKNIGNLLCDVHEDSITIKGEATLFMKGEFILEERKFERGSKEEKTKLAIAL